MGVTKEKDAAGWLMGSVGEAKPKRALPLNEYAPAPEEIDALLADTAGDGKKLAAGLKRGMAALNDLANAGFSFDCLITLAVEKAPYPRGAKHKLSREQMIAALKGVFAIGEYLSP